MSIESMAIVLNHSKSTGTNRNVLVSIANHDGDGGAWPAIRTLAKQSGGVSHETVRRSLRELEDLGEIITHPRQGGTAGTPDHARTNRYEITLRCPAECDGTASHRMPGEPGYRPRVTPASPPHSREGTPPTAARGQGTVLEPSLEPSGEPVCIPPASSDGTDTSGDQPSRERDGTHTRSTNRSDPPTQGQDHKPRDPARPARKTRFPTGWQPDPDLIDWTRQHAPGVGSADVDAFRDHHTAHGSLRADWSAAWRSWATEAQRRIDTGRRTGQRSTPAPSKPSTTDNRVVAALTLAEQLRQERLMREGHIPIDDDEITVDPIEIGS